MYQTQRKPEIALLGRELKDTYNTLTENGFKPLWQKSRIWETGSQKDLYVLYVEDEGKFSMSYVTFIDGIKAVYPNSKIMLCGPYANSAEWKPLYNSRADLISIGNDDGATILELCQKFFEEHKYQEITGLGFKSPSIVGGEQIWIGNRRETK